MTKDDLIEKLAEASHTWLNDDAEWEEAGETTKQNYRAVIVADFLPVVVEFVTEWLVAHGADDGFYLSDTWHEEMAS